MIDLFLMLAQAPAKAPYRPFLDPIDLHRLSFLLIIPLALGIAVAYKAMRLDDLKDYARQVVIMTIQTVFGMVALGVAGYFFVEWVLPLIVPR